MVRILREEKVGLHPGRANWGKWLQAVAGPSTFVFLVVLTG